MNGPAKGVRAYYEHSIDELLEFLRSSKIKNADALDDIYFTRVYWDALFGGSCEPKVVLRADPIPGSHNKHGSPQKYVVKEFLNCLGDCGENADCVAAGQSVSRDGCFPKTRVA